MIERGFSFVTIASDARLLAMAAKSAIDEMRASPHASRGEPAGGFRRPDKPQAGY